MNDMIKEIVVDIDIDTLKRMLHWADLVNIEDGFELDDARVMRTYDDGSGDNDPGLVLKFLPG